MRAHALCRLFRDLPGGGEMQDDRIDVIRRKRRAEKDRLPGCMRERSLDRLPCPLHDAAEWRRIAARKLASVCAIT